MIKPGICSISFRDLSAAEVVTLAKQANLAGVEWGGDVHVPHGDLEAAKRVLELSRQAGLFCPSYGSYYRAGVSEKEGLKFQDVLAAAGALDAATVRVWAGNRNLEAADPALVSAVVEDTLRIAELAAAEGMSVSFEYHGNTFTNTNRNAQKFASMVDHAAVRFYWQPPHGGSDADCIAGMQALLDRITNVHVFQWRQERRENGRIRNERLLLEEGRERWRQFLGVLAQTGREHWAFLEFARDDNPANALRDARTLGALIAELE